jgi:hypothetical protein
MDAGTLVAIATGAAGVLGGYVGGRRNTPLAESTITMLQAQLSELRLQVEIVPVLQQRIVVLEDLVTQRAKVDEVLEIVTEIRERFDAS